MHQDNHNRFFLSFGTASSEKIAIQCFSIAIFACLQFCFLTQLCAQDISFSRDIQPILADNCFQCHGFDANTREADLRLDTWDGATGELLSGEGSAVVPGEPGESVLLQRVNSDDKYSVMPPPGSEKSLTQSQKELLRKWISQGAKYENHWAFEQPQNAPLPEIKNKSWPRNLIDHFVLTQLEKKGINPSPAADKRTLIRRVAFDLTGLPPTKEQIDRFLGDDSDDAYEKMVDRYLASPSYGEHMTRHWLDLARYADTSGYQYDRERSMWVWRDWVINAYNSNMPFDQFTVEQLAGDLLPNATPQQILATGFNRNHPITIEGGVIDEEYRTEYVIDRLNTTATVWMGLTVGCSRCHDHKFDPISQKEFYQLTAFFNQVAERGLNGFEPMQQIASPLAEPVDPTVQQKMDDLKTQIDKLKAEPSAAEVNQWAKEIATTTNTKWQILDPVKMSSSGGSILVRQDDKSILAGGANPNKDVYEIASSTQETMITAIRLECLTDDSLPGGGPGRHSNSNFVLSEFELVAVSIADPNQRQTIKFSKAIADYSQANYEIAKAIDGTVSGNNGWAVDGPTRKKPATAIFIATAPFGFEGGTELKFRLRHEANFATHGIGRPRLSLTTATPDSLALDALPDDVLVAARKHSNQRSQKERLALNDALKQVRSQKTTALQNQFDQISPLSKYPKTMVMKDLAKPRSTYILERGQYDLKREEVAADVPAILNQFRSDLPRNRLGFANWLTDPDHPLTARVAVNRYWQMLFGRGLVGSVEDFGTQGDWPTHPELLDALAIEFVDSGWNVKAMLRLILNSATYRQSSKSNAESLEQDPKNQWLVRGPRFRLDAEQIRDQALALSGLLNQKIGGPSVYPYQPDGLWLELNNRPGLSRKYVEGTGDELYRRSMYTFWKRTVLSPMMQTFDATGREFCTARRFRTNTPLQALLLLNGPQFVEAARHFGKRMIVEGGDNSQSRIKFGFEMATSRLPDEVELAILTTYLENRLDHYRSNPKAAIKMLRVGQSAQNNELDSIEHAAWMDVARTLLNLDETINRN